MKQRQIDHLESLHRIQLCLDTFADHLTVVDLTLLRRELDESVHLLENAASDRAEAITSESSHARLVSDLRDHLLRHHMAPIAEFARSAASNMSSIQDQTMPPENVSEIALVAWATAMANGAARHRERFVEMGFPTAFIEELQQAIDEYEAAIAARTRSRLIRVTTKETLKLQFGRARERVRLIAVLIRREFGDRQDLITAWQAATLHAPRLRAQHEIKQLPAGGARALIGAGSGTGELAPSTGAERPSLLRRVFRLFGDAA